MQNHIFYQGLKIEFWQYRVVEKFDAIEKRELTPKYFVFGVEAVAAGAERMGAGSCVNDDGVLPLISPLPHMSKRCMQSDLRGSIVSFGGEWHAAAMTGDVFGDV